jgi:hypothetical protein
MLVASEAWLVSQLQEVIEALAWPRKSSLQLEKACSVTPGVMTMDLLASRTQRGEAEIMGWMPLPFWPLPEPPPMGPMIAPGNWAAKDGGEFRLVELRLGMKGTEGVCARPVGVLAWKFRSTPGREGEV